MIAKVTRMKSPYFVKSADNEWKVYAKDANDKVATQLINTEDVDDTVVVHNK